jgi:lipopolysaccharide transport system ATP-binding protein
MREPVIALQDVSKNYILYRHFTGGIKHFLFHLPQALKIVRGSRYQVLNHVSFEVHKGESFGVIGKNGAGKSTILGLMAGVLKPSGGKITVYGTVGPLLELGAGFHPDLTGRENIVLNGVLLGLTKRQVLSKMDEIIDFSELFDFIDQPLRTYSSGMLARLAFSVVSSLEADILLIDEILAVGDINFQRKCMRRLIDHKNGGGTMVLVSHTMQDIEALCDRVLMVENCGVRGIGTPGEIVPMYSSQA